MKTVSRKRKKKTVGFNKEMIGSLLEVQSVVEGRDAMRMLHEWLPENQREAVRSAE